MADSKPMVAPCGIICSECPAFIATRDNNDALRRECAEKWSLPENPIDPATVNCDGCTPASSRCIGDAFCEVRKCAGPRAVATCAACADYACDKLRLLWAQFDTSKPKETLEALRARA